MAKLNNKAHSETNTSRAFKLVPKLATRVRELRRTGRLTLKELSRRSGVSTSALSKIENGQLSPTYEKIIALAYGLDVDITELFAHDTPHHVTGRRSVTRRGEGTVYDTSNYTYELLCADLSNKQLSPAVTTVKARSLESFGAMSSHEGEELIFVLQGSIVLHTEFYEPIRLAKGDCAYFDSRMRHACVAEGSGEAIVMWVSSSGTPQRVLERLSPNRNGGDQTD